MKRRHRLFGALLLLTILVETIAGYPAPQDAAAPHTTTPITRSAAGPSATVAAHI